MEKDTIYVALDDSKRKVVVAILRPGQTQPEQREMPKAPAPHPPRVPAPEARGARPGVL